MDFFSSMYSINPPLEGCIRTVGFLQLLRTSRDFASAHCSRLCPQTLAPRLPPFFGWTLQSYSPTASYRYSQLLPRRNEFRQMSEGSIQWANVSHMAAAYPLEPSDLELGSPSQVHWSEKIKHQILLLRLQRRGFVGGGWEKAMVRVQEL